MSDQISLCKVRYYNEIGYSVIEDENPEKYYKQLNKNIIKYNPEATTELLEYKKKDYSVIVVYVKASNKIKKIRELIENKKYQYEQKYETLDSKVNLSELFKMNFSFTSLKDFEMNNKTTDILKFIDSTEDIIVYKTVKGCYLCKYYFYNKNVKYLDIINEIKKDFKFYYDKGNFISYIKDKLSVPIETDLDLDKIKKANKLYLNSKAMGKLDCLWLKSKLGIDFDSSQINNEDFINNLKLNYKGKDPNYNSSYIDLSSVSKQSYDENDDVVTDEKLLLSKEELNEYNAYMNELHTKYGSNVYEEFIGYYYADKIDESEYAKVKRIIYKKEKVVFEEIIKNSDLKPWNLIVQEEEI